MRWICVGGDQGGTIACDDGPSVGMPWFWKE